MSWLEEMDKMAEVWPFICCMRALGHFPTDEEFEAWLSEELEAA